MDNAILIVELKHQPKRFTDFKMLELKLSATNISRTDNLLKFCILLALVNVYPKQFKKYMVTMETIEIGQIIN